MLIPVPTGDCRTAVVAALAQAQGVLDADRETIREKSYNALHAGAVHNGLKPSQADLDQMASMADNDVTHMMENHPANEHVEHFKNFLDMIDYAENMSEDMIIVDDADFRLLKKHLPER
jgi:hypothetical protein